jgi:uncharacterized protein
MRTVKTIDFIAILLTVIAALNWGLFGVFNQNLITMIFGTAVVAKVLYIVIALAGVWSLLWLFKCSASSKNTTAH